jgi:hypothetical protein
LNPRGFAGILPRVGSSITFFRLLACLAAGGLAATALVPSRGVSRGFFKFAAMLYAALIAAAFAAGGPAVPVAARGALGLAAVFALAPLRWHGRGMQAALAVAAGLAAGAVVAGPAIAGGALGVAAVLLSAALLGSAFSAMILGHWYLVMPLLPPDPLLRLTRLFAGSVVARLAAVIAAFAALHSAGGRDLDRFLDRAGMLIWPRLLFGLGGPLVLAAMALPTVKQRDTQPATGMLYVACVLVLVGEGIAQYLGALTGVPV